MVGYATGSLLKKTANLRRALRTMSCLAIPIARNPKDRSSEKSAEDDGKPPVDIFDLVCIHISGDLNAIGTAQATQHVVLLPITVPLHPSYVTLGRPHGGLYNRRSPKKDR